MYKKSLLILCVLTIIMAILIPSVAYGQGKVIVLYGDSQFSGKTTVAAKLAAKRADNGDTVITIADSWTSHHAKKNIKKEVIKPYSPNVIVLNFGLNDASRDTKGHNRNKLSTYVNNMKSAIKKAQKTGAQVIVLTPIPLDYNTRAGLWTDSDIAAYASSLAGLASSMGVTVIDAYTLFKSQPNYHLNLLADGLHFSDQGSELIADQIDAAIP
jgi:lysophospholipase L1-like esterase